MKNILIILSLVLFFAKSSNAQNLSKQVAESFIDALINNSDDLENFFDASELKLSARLGITYKGVKHKSLISLDIDPALKQKLLTHELKYTYKIEPLESEYSKLLIEIPEGKINYEFIFKKGKMISKVDFFAMEWPRVRSKYFVFHVSKEYLLNDYSISKLDSFVDKMLHQLACSTSEIKKLEAEKIHYFLCKDEDEIKLLTNYATRGMYYLANDYIISTFNSHYHEIAHLLINYKLKSVDLFTLPVLQEGFAVAFGGRGGQESKVILNMGIFLVKSNMLDYDALLSKSSFSQLDPSVTYPISGLYTKFLIDKLGMPGFLELYKKYSADAVDINKLQLTGTELPAKKEWDKFVTESERDKDIQVSGIVDLDLSKNLVENENIHINENDSVYLVKIKTNTTFKKKGTSTGYKSKLFVELFPSGKYKREKYVIMAASGEVSIYNFLTNNLIAKYVQGFSLTNEPVPQKDGFFVFTLKKKVFDEPLNLLEIVNGNI